MISRIFYCLLFLIILCLKSKVLSSPVLFWSNVKLPQSTVPLSSISPLNLISDYICKLTNEQIQLRIFAVNDLKIEDIQHGSQSDHPILVDAKKDKTNFRFYPNVNGDVYQTFSLIPQSNNMKCSHIHFQLASVKIYEKLTDALNIMQTTIDHISTNENDPIIIALVNGPVDGQKLSRKRRQTSGTQVLVSNNNTCMFYAKELYWNDVNGTKSTGRVYNLRLNESSCQPNTTTITNGTLNSIVVNLVWDNTKAPFDTVNMKLIATIIGRYWYLTNAFLNNSEYRYFAYGMHSQMDTPPTFSYVCSSATFVQFDDVSTKYGKYNFTNKFYLTNLQFQPFKVNGLVFGQPNYCTSFFTSGIWMGITSSLLCLAILLFGVYRMMSIKTNDRFDDPKGKPLIIKAQD